MEGVDELNKDKQKGFHWAEQSKLLIQRVEEIMRKLLPCPMTKIIAEAKYQTGLSDKKVSEIMSIFVNREVVKLKKMDYKGQDKICVVLSDA